jgi:hypothetical protein
VQQLQELWMLWDLGRSAGQSAARQPFALHSLELASIANAGLLPELRCGFNHESMG